MHGTSSICTMDRSLFPKSQCDSVLRNSLYIDNDPFPPQTSASCELCQMILVSTTGARNVKLCSCEKASQDVLDAWQAARKPFEPLLPRKAGSPGGTQETCHRCPQPPHRWLRLVSYEAILRRSNLTASRRQPRAMRLAAIRGKVFLRAYTPKQRLICHITRFSAHVSICSASCLHAVIVSCLASVSSLCVLA